MSLSCPKCGDGNVQSVAVILESGTQTTVSEETRKGMGGPMLFTLPGLLTSGQDFKTGNKSYSTTETELVKSIRRRLAKMDEAIETKYNAEKDALDKKISNAVEKAEEETPTPKWDQVRQKILQVSGVVAIIIALYDLAFTRAGFISSIIHGLIYWLIFYWIFRLVASVGLKFFKPDLALTIAEEKERRKKAVGTAETHVKGEQPSLVNPEYPSRKYQGEGFFCHKCGEMFIPDFAK